LLNRSATARWRWSRRGDSSGESPDFSRRCTAPELAEVLLEVAAESVGGVVGFALHLLDDRQLLSSNGARAVVREEDRRHDDHRREQRDQPEHPRHVQDLLERADLALLRADVPEQTAEQRFAVDPHRGDSTPGSAPRRRQRRRRSGSRR
jgi:hypothetical protein